MPTEDVSYQQRLKIRRTTLGFGVIQVVLGLALTGLSFTAFVLSESEKIRNACPYWAGFTVFCSGGVGIVAWRYTTVLSMGLFTFFSAVCVVLHMIGTILTGEIGGLLKSILMCQNRIVTQTCVCCDSIMTCKQNVPTFEFEGVEDCSIITGLIKELMYGLCVLNIFGSLVCFIATILGCTSVARQAGRAQPLFRRRLSARSDSHEQSQYSWLHYPADANVLPPYAPPLYRSVDNMQDCGATPYIVPPPVFDPTDLPPPYSSRNASLSSSRLSLNVHDPIPPSGRPRDSDGSAGGSAAIVISEGNTLIHHHYENRYQPRVYSENRPRPGNLSQVTNVVLTRVGVLERCGTGTMTRHSLQSISSSHGSLASEKAEECRESSESIHDRDQNYKSKQTSRCLTTVEHSSELIMFEETNNKRKTNKENKKKSKTSHKKQCKVTEDEISTTSDSGIGDELSLLNTSSEIGDGDSFQSGRESPDSVEEKEIEIDSSEPDENHQEYDLNRLTFSLCDAVSLESQDNQYDSGTNLSTDTLVETEHPEACQLSTNMLSVVRNFIEEMPTSQIDSPQDQAGESEIICTSNVEDINENNENIIDNEANIIDNGMVQFTGNSIYERHITEEVIRLMDDFDSGSAESGACGVDPQLVLPHQPHFEDMSHVTDYDLCTNRREGQLNEGQPTSSYIEKQISPQSLKPSGTSTRVEKGCTNKGMKPLTRSDTCIAAISKPSRESRTGSDPGVSGIGGLVYPGRNFAFQLVPPNVELPLEIREENMCADPMTTPQQNKRRKRPSDRDELRSKRRALASKEEMARHKAKCQHPASLKDEAAKPRERHQRTQTTRHRAELTRSYLQSYKAKSSAQRGRDGWLKDSFVWPSLRKGTTRPQRYATTSSLSNQASGEGSCSACGNCTGKETIV